MHPMHTYYHYTTARIYLIHFTRKIVKEKAQVMKTLRRGKDLNYVRENC